MRRWIVFPFLAVLEAVVRRLMPRASTHRLLLAPGIEPLRWKLGRLRAWRTFEQTARRVPAYREFLAERGFPRRLDVSNGLEAAFDAVPETDKDSYIKRWSIPERCLDGRIPRRGVIVDESSGSSGTPTSWIRGPRERQATRQILQLGYTNTAQSMQHPPFVLNAFSLGAWATGMNVTTSLTDVSMIKSIGPDKNKIIQTIREFGPDHTYVILSYPPFLKSLFDDPRLDWSRYDIVAAFGGEGISESMRDHILRVAHSAYGSYGASDLEINLALETDFTIELRRAIADHPELAERISKKAEYGVLPMVFQFNPFNYLIETNDRGELLVTIARSENLNPRIRYNIHDRGHVLRVSELEPILRELGLARVLRAKQLDLSILFHYGRSDLSVDFNGAVVGPDSLRDVINAHPLLLDAVENHRLISFEDEHGDRQLHLAIQLVEGHDPASLDAEAIAAEIFSELRRANGDFHNAILTSDDAMLPTIAFYGFRTGPFEGDGAKLKNEYVAHLDAAGAAGSGLDLSIVARKRLG
ncbi:MAG: CoF synthetase [Leucobacter sp.]